MAGHALPAAGVPGIPLGSGLSPGDASSVEPKGIPIGGTGEPGAIPSGEVAPITGVGAPMPPIWATAGLHPKTIASTAAVSVTRIVVSIVQARLWYEATAGA